MKVKVITAGLPMEGKEVPMSYTHETNPTTTKKANETLYTVNMTSCTAIATFDANIRTMYHVQGGEVNPEYYDNLVELIADDATVIFSDGASGADKASAQRKLDAVQKKIEERMPDASLKFVLFYTAIEEGIRQDPVPGSLVLKSDGSYGRALRPVESDDEDDDDDDDE